MLKFFRKIRRSLIESGSAGKYLIYAVGEIALVVIGILIALQINNWQKQQESDKWELYYLNRFAEDFQSDIEEFEESLKYSYENVMIGNSILIELGEDLFEDAGVVNKAMVSRFLNKSKRKYPELDSLQSLPLAARLRRLTEYRNITIRRYTYDELLSSGRLELIDNNQLRGAISSYYYRAEDVLHWDAELLKSLEDYQNFLNSENVPKDITGSYTSIGELIEDQPRYKTVLRNLLSSHLVGRSLYDVTIRGRAENLLPRINGYLEDLR